MPFECEADGLHQFLKDVHDRANEMGWTMGIVRIGAEENENEVDNARENLIDHNGSITLERIIKADEENIDNEVVRYATSKPLSCIRLGCPSFPSSDLLYGFVDRLVML